MLVYDLEIGAHNFLVGAYDGKTFTQLDNTQRDEIIKFYEAHIEDIWAGWNSANYDSIIFKLILLGYTPEAIFEKSNSIIGKGLIDGSIAKKSIKNANDLWNFKLYDLDLMNVLKSHNSLKELEGYLGTSINETTVDFELDRPWTPQELEEMKEYNRYDLKATWEYMLICKETIKAKIMLIQKYNLPKKYISMTNAQLTAEILGAKYMNFDDGLATYDPNTAPIEINKYKECVEFFTSMPQMDESAKKNVMIAGCPHTIACGGLHGALDSYFYEGEMWMLDVASYYPNMMINFNLTPRSQSDPTAFKSLVAERMGYKKAGNKTMANILKLPINTVSGCMKAKFSKLFDEKHNNYMCITGQLLLIDLIEHIEPYCELIQWT